MGAVSVTSKGQVTIPVKVRRTLGIGLGTRVTFTAKSGVARLEVSKWGSQAKLSEGAGMLAVRGQARSLLAFDAPLLVKRGK